MPTLDPLDGLVMPRRLFDDGGRPPVDSFEIYLPAPAGLSILASRVAHDARTWDLLRGIYQSAAVRAVAQLGTLAMSGPVATHPRAAMRLQISARVHAADPDDDAAVFGWHMHLYVGSLGHGVHDGLPRHADLLLNLALAAHEVYLDHRAWLQASTYDVVQWRDVPGLEFPEPISFDPGQLAHFALQIATCPGEYAPLPRLRADDPLLMLDPLAQIPPARGAVAQAA